MAGRVSVIGNSLQTFAKRLCVWLQAQQKRRIEAAEGCPLNQFIRHARSCESGHERLEASLVRSERAVVASGGVRQNKWVELSRCPAARTATAVHVAGGSIISIFCHIEAEATVIQPSSSAPSDAGLPGIDSIRLVASERVVVGLVIRTERPQQHPPVFLAPVSNLLAVGGAEECTEDADDHFDAVWAAWHT